LIWIKPGGSCEGEFRPGLPMFFSRRASVLVAVAALAVIYIVAGKLSLEIAFLQASASPVWPPAGIAVAALLVLGYRVWPVIFAGAFLVNLTTAGNFTTSFCIATGNTLEALCGAWLVNRFAGGTRVFERAQDVFKFVVIAAASTALSASIGPTSLALGGFASWEKYGAIWLTWWLGDMTGYLIVAPLVLLWWIRPRWQEDIKRTLEAILLLVLLVLLGEAVFGNWFPGFIRGYPIAFLCGPVILWTAFRFPQREAITGVSVLAAIALWGTLHGYGPFRMGSVNQSLLVLQAWAAVWTLTSLTLAAAMGEHRRAEAALEEQKAAVELANRTKDNFLAMLSHELRTPLTPVMALLDWLEMEPEPREEFRESLRIIRRNIDLESRLIDDLLDLTRIARGKLKLELKPIDAHEAITQVVEMCRSEINAKTLGVTLELRARAFHIAADPAKYQQIIWNLLKNAIKFTPEKGEITIASTNDTPESLEIVVRDTGIGIEPGQIGRVFDAFEQGDESYQQRHGGLGLGLAISKAIAQEHGGSLVVMSGGRNRGTTFRLTMSTIASPALPAARRGSQPLAAEQPAWRILLVEDHADTSSALRNLLARRGHRVGIAHDVRSALEVAGNDSFDLMISDLGLPDGTGVELMTKLRGTGMRGIAISGFGMRADVERSLAAGFVDHLVKPVKFEKLEAAIEKAMRVERECSTSVSQAKVSPLPAAIRNQAADPAET
jgi:signal transduction histidine kinase/CheY-like chemotaxis protein